MHKKDGLTVASYSYLILPFLIFVLGWLKLPISLGILLAFGWLGWRNRDRILSAFHLPQRPERDVLIGVLLLGVWVLLSGIGGYAFQNQDLNIRNAIFHDLLSYRWPVLYPAQAGIPARGLVYYIGFWLPAALVGKLAGWNAGNAFLFLWTCLGVFLVAAQIRRRLNSSMFLAVLLLVSFSGMDILGLLYTRANVPGVYPGIWPPIRHIEGWLPGTEYSSFTTQLYWVFNQALPAWLCTVMLLNSTSKRALFLIWSLCFFFAPLPALGLIPLAAYEILSFSRSETLPEGMRASNAWTQWMDAVQRLVYSLVKACSVENILGGGIVAGISYLYFSVNSNASIYSTRAQNFSSIGLSVLFILVEGGVLWFLLLSAQRKDPRFYLVGLLLIVFPFLAVGGSGDLTMRGSIPALFYLMVYAGEGIYRQRNIFRIPILVCLLIGAATPIYEINRSVVQTAVYAMGQITHSPAFEASIPVAVGKYKTFQYIYPTTIVDDEVKTLGNYQVSEAANFIARWDDSFFLRYLAKSDRQPQP